MRRSLAFLILLAGLTPALAMQAQQPGSALQWHALLNWAYVRTDGNHYLEGTEDGNYSRLDFWLNASATLNPRLRLVSQAGWEQEGEEGQVVFDYAFAEWRPAASIQLRIGKVKQPFGISAEIFDVGTLRPFMDLPQSIYGGTGFFTEGYYGLGVSSPLPAVGKWRASVDAYVGGMDISETHLALDYLRGTLDSAASEEEVTRVSGVVGGRLLVETPLSGLSVGTSAFTGRSIEHDRRYASLGVQAEYRSDRLLLQSEYAAMWETAREIQRGVYFQAAWRATRHWQVAGLYGRLSTTLPGIDPSPAPSLLRHQEWAAGLNYWFDPSFVLKTSVTRVSGNRFAGPEAADLAAAIASGTLRQRTWLIQLGAAVAF